MFKWVNGELQIRKIEVPDNELDFNVMSDLQMSYQKYIEKTIHEDMEYLVEELQQQKGMEDIGLTIKVGSLKSYMFDRTQVKPGTSYYPVYGTFTKGGRPVGDDRLLLRIPYMDDYGKINVNGKSKVVLMVLRSAEDISYNLQQGLFNIAMPYANIRIYASKKHIRMKLGKQNIDMGALVTAMLFKAGDKTPIHEYLTNTLLTQALNLNPYISPSFTYEDLNKRSNIFKRLESVQYKLGNTREALNENLSIDRAIGQILSRDILSYKEGDLITESMIKDFKRNRINTVYVKNDIIPEGYTYASNQPIIITEIPAGTKNCSLLRTIIPEYSGEVTIPVDVQLSSENAIVISNSEPLTKNVIEFLVNNGWKELPVVAGNYSSTAKIINISFEREIIGNYTARLKELTTNIPKGRYADEWVYFYNNPNLDKVDDSQLTAHDMLAILSVIGQIMLTGKSTLLDRDTSFLKKVLMINEIFSETLREAIHEYVNRYGASIQKNISSISSNNPFGGLTTKWIKTLTENKFLATPDTVNISSEVSQACHVVTEISSSSSVKDEQRHLAIPFYGRICPYETPAGKKLGIVNTKAIGTKVRDGLFYTPYRKVLATSNGIRLSDKITWLSVKDELGFKFGDILSLQKDESGNYMNTPILARVPNHNSSDEPFIFRNINSFDLAGGYVTAYPEQFISPTARLVPWLCSDDPTRVSFGSSQIRQSIYEYNSEAPLVNTPMYRDMFKYSDTVKYYALDDGKCTYIDNMRAEFKGNNGENFTVHMQGFSYLGSEDAVVDLKIKAGDSVTKGQSIAEAFKYPQPFVVRAPYDCTVMEINDDGITIQRSATKSSFVDLTDCDIIKLSNGRIMGQSVIFMNIHVSVGDRLHKGQIIADTCASRGGVYSPARNPLVAYISCGYNYEDGICATEKSSIEYTNMIAHHIDETVNKYHYNNARAKIQKGFKYCSASDKIGEIVSSKGLDKGKSFSKPVRATMKENGIPFEIETLEDDNNSRTYRYHLVGFSKLQAGDKMAGRHGNKGVVSKVTKDSEAYQLLNGKIIDFVLNPCGVPSRMNLGQIYDAEAGLIATVLGITISVDSFNGASEEDLRYLMQYTWTLANTVGIGDNISKKYNKALFDSICNSFKELPKELHEAVWKNIENVIDWRGVFDVEGNAEIYDPETETILDGKVTIGYPYFFKLMQLADEKINVRSGPLDEQYARVSSQPQKGNGSAKGQRMAEMELVALAALGASEFIREILNEKSDNSGERINRHLEQLGLPYAIDKSSCTSRAVETLLYELEACGIKLEVPDEIADVSFATSRNKYTLDLNKLIYEKLTCNANEQSVQSTVPDILDIED